LYSRISLSESDEGTGVIDSTDGCFAIGATKEDDSVLFEIEERAIDCALDNERLVFGGSGGARCIDLKTSVEEVEEFDEIEDDLDLLLTFVLMLCVNC